MAQLIKLEDCISRYEWDIYRYPSQFIRLKQDNWKKLLDAWQENIPTYESIEWGESLSPIQKLLSKLKRNAVSSATDGESNMDNPLQTEEELKQQFLDDLYAFQLKWASSTVSDVSYFKRSYHKDPVLKYFLQRFPDNYLIMYHPIFSIKHAPMEAEIMMISPIGMEIIYLLEAPDYATIICDDERAWVIDEGKSQSKIVSPVIALKRTETIVKGILQQTMSDFPIRKTVLSRTNHILLQHTPYHTSCIGKRDYAKWFKEKRALDSPLKSSQLKVAERLLKHCLTTSVKRPEWEEDATFTYVDEE